MDKIVMIVGWIGSVNILLAYALLSRGKLSSEKATYHGMNLIGAICNFSFVLYKSAWSSAFLEFTWATIALISISKIIKIKEEENQEKIDDFGDKVIREDEKKS